MGRMTIWLEENTEDSVREYAKKHNISFSSALARAWLRYLKHQSGESKRWRELVEKIEDKEELDDLREEGKILQREIAYGSINLERSLTAIMNNPTLSEKQKKYWKKETLKHSIKRREVATSYLQKGRR